MWDWTPPLITEHDRNQLRQRFVRDFSQAIQAQKIFAAELILDPELVRIAPTIPPEDPVRLRNLIEETVFRIAKNKPFLLEEFPPRSLLFPTSFWDVLLHEGIISPAQHEQLSSYRGD